jgi:hypothetical protein
LNGVELVAVGQVRVPRGGLKVTFIVGNRGSSMVLGSGFEMVCRHAVVITDGLKLFFQHVFANWGCVFGHGIPVH